MASGSNVTVTAREIGMGRPVAVAAAARRAAGDQPAWTLLLPTERVAAAAAAADPGAPLAGLPFAVKDNIDLAGTPTTAACPALADRPAGADAAAVARLVEAGAVPIGKTNMDQFATGLVGTRSPYGACHSVVSPAHVAGGSSTGSAVVVAAGLVPLALGTDTAGSGRVPAAFNGIVGVKPTRGLISTTGVFPACPGLDCVTTFTRTVSDARAALAALVRFDPDDPWARPAPARTPDGIAARLRVVAVPDASLDLAPAHEAAWAGAVDWLRGVAAEVVPVDVAPFLAAARLLYDGPWVAARYAAFGHLLEPDGPHLDPTVRRIVLRGREVTGADVFAGLERLAVLRRATEPVWRAVDALMLPVTPDHPRLAEVAADPVGVNARLGRFTNFVNLLDLAAVAVPAGSRPDGLPFGVQFVAPAFADEPLLDLAATWCGEPVAGRPEPAGHTLLAVPAGRRLDALAGRRLDALATLDMRGRMPAGHRPADSGLGFTPARSGEAGGGAAVEVWRMPDAALGGLLAASPALRAHPVDLADGTTVTALIADAAE
jgi:allophanate hydrolase